MKQKIIDWIREDMINNSLPSLKTEYYKDSNSGIKTLIDGIAEEKGTALYLHLFKDKE